MEEEVNRAVNRLIQQEEVVHVQTGWSGFDPPDLWSRASKKERKDLIITEVTRMEQEEYGAVAQGCRAIWDEVVS